MNKEDFKLSIKRVFTDRPFLWMMASLVVTGFLYCLIVGLNVRVSDVTVYSRYTAFGEGHFYKAPWQYLLSFVVFGAVVVVTHLSLMVKLHNLDRRQTALLLGVIGIVVLVVAGGYALAVMQLGRVS